MKKNKNNYDDVKSLLYSFAVVAFFENQYVFSYNCSSKAHLIFLICLYIQIFRHFLKYIIYNFFETHYRVVEPMLVVIFDYYNYIRNKNLCLINTNAPEA